MTQPKGGQPRLKVGAGFLGHIARNVTVADYVAAAEEAEAAGLDSFWVADQRWARDAWTTLAAIAEHTRRISLGTRITDPYIRHPAVTAVKAATLDELSGGRFILGMGAGGSGFSQIGLERSRPAAALRDAITIIRRLLAGDECPHHGEVISWGGGKLEFPTRPTIPIVVASRGPKLLALTGEIADGAIIATGTHESAIQWARTHIEAGAEAAGRHPSEIELLHQTYVSVDDDAPEAAIQAAKLGIVGAVTGSYPRFEFLAAAGLTAPQELVAYLEAGGRDHAGLVQRIPDEFVDRLCAAGTSEQVTEKILGMRDAGISHVLVAAIPSRGEGELGQLRRLFENVLPKVR